MKTRTANLFVLMSLLITAGACRTVKIETPLPPVVHPKPALVAVKKSAAPKLPTKEIPQALGGIVQSDSWVIYKDTQREEFTGHVSYDNGAYIFKADYALSERAKNKFTARGNVFLRQNNTDGTFYEAYAQRGIYNYKTQQGELCAGGKNPVKLVYQDDKKQTTTATAKQARFDLAEKIYILEGDVHGERVGEQGTQTVTAQKMTVKPQENFVQLDGDATLTDGERSLVADTIIYDGQHNASYAYGARPLVQGKTEQGTFAVIADKIQSDAQGSIIHLDGSVQGWLVSPEINENKLNSKF